MTAIANTLVTVFKRHRAFEAAKPDVVEVHAPADLPTAAPDQPTLELPMPALLANRPGPGE